MALPKIILDALGLDEDAPDEKALSAITALQERPEKPSDKTLAQLATESGSVVLSNEDYINLRAGAAAGLDASKKLAELRFETEFDKALSQGRVTPAQRETFAELFELDADKAVKALSQLPEGIHMSADGSADGGVDAGVPAEVKLDAENFGIDEDRVALHNRALAIAAEKGIDYDEGVHLAAAELGV